MYSDTVQRQDKSAILGEKICLLHANNKTADLPAHQRKLIGAFISLSG